MDAGGDRLQDKTGVAIIREVYEGEFSHQAFAMKLEQALDASCPIIVIEPMQLGDETARWISVGNCLHKTAVLTGLGSIAACLLWSRNPFAYTPLGGFSLLCTGLYTASWQFDNCVKYQVEKDPRNLLSLSVTRDLSAASPVVLIRKDDTYRKLLHCSISLTAASLCGYRLYRYFK